MGNWWLLAIRWVGFAIGNMAFHSCHLYTDLIESIPFLLVFMLNNFPMFHNYLFCQTWLHCVTMSQLVRSKNQVLLHDDDDKSRANAAGAIGNLVRNSDQLCPEIAKFNVVPALLELIERYMHNRPGSVKIALFSLGNIIAHGQIRSSKDFPARKTVEICNRLRSRLPETDVIHKYAHRVLTKLSQDQPRFGN